MDQGRWTEAADRVARALALVDEYRMYDYAPTVLSFAAAARLALHRAKSRDGSTADTGHAGATVVHLCLSHRCGAQPAPAGQGLLGARRPRTARHLLREIDDVLGHRPDLGILVDEVREFRGLVASGAGGPATGGPPLTPAELRLLPYLQTHLTIAEIGERLFVSRNTVSSEVASIYRKLGVSSRNDAVQRATVIGLLGG